MDKIRLTPAHFEARILALIDALVEQGSDDDLFASSYLRDHVTLAMDTLSGALPLTALSAAVEAQVDAALARGELSPADQALVQAMWQQLVRQAAANE